MIVIQSPPLHSAALTAILSFVRATFLVNLRNLTVEQEFVNGARPQGYLAPPAYLTAALRTAAQNRATKVRLMVDNGRFDDIAVLARTYAQDAASALEPTPDLDEIADLVRRVSDTAHSTLPALSLAEQLELRPNAVIGEEDILPATLLRLGLDIKLVPDSRRLLARVNTGVLEKAAVLLPGLDQASDVEGAALLPPRHHVAYHPVLSAFDYDTAFDAGRSGARASCENAAIGFGAYMADDSYTDRYKRGGHWRRLPSKMPQRYLRTALVAQGLWDGWAQESGGAPKGFHFLGLGAPIMLGLVALAGFESDQLTFDATSPIRDATEGTLYFREPALLKVRTRSLAARLCDDLQFEWPCACPFCATFLGEHPLDRDGGASWRLRNADRSLTAADLQASSELGGYFPILAEPRGGEERKRIDMARIGHNHWSLERITEDINRHSRTRDSLTAWVDNTVHNYENTTNSDTFARAVRFAYQVIH